MFNSRQLQDHLAAAKAQAVTDQRNNQGTVEVQPQEGFGYMSDPNEAYKTMVVCGIPPDDAGKIVMQGPEAVQGALTQQTQQTQQRPEGVSSYVWDRVQQGTLEGLNPATITHGDGATRDALIAAGHGDYVKAAYEKSMDQRADHYGGNGAQNAMENAQLGWYNERYGNYGGQSDPQGLTTLGQPPEQLNQTQPMGQPVPIQQQGNPGGMASALMGVGNIVRGNNGTQPNHNGNATNASNMFNGLAGINNLVRGNNGTQPTYQPEPVQYTPPPQGPYSQPGPTGMPMTGGDNPPRPPTEYRNGVQPNNQPGPQWGGIAPPPGTGGGNPGFTGMMSNTGDTMAALKALAQRFRQ
jgi:hypothetical protein